MQTRVISRFARIYAVPRPLLRSFTLLLPSTPSTYTRCTAEDQTRAGLFRGLWLSSTRKKNYNCTKGRRRNKKKSSSSLYLSPRFPLSRYFFIVALPAVGTPEAPFLAARHCVNPSRRRCSVSDLFPPLPTTHRRHLLRASVIVRPRLSSLARSCEAKPWPGARKPGASLAAHPY